MGGGERMHPFLCGVIPLARLLAGGGEGEWVMICPRRMDVRHLSNATSCLPRADTRGHRCAPRVRARAPGDAGERRGALRSETDASDVWKWCGWGRVYETHTRETSHCVRFLSILCEKRS